MDEYIKLKNENESYKNFNNDDNNNYNKEVC